MVFWIVYTMMHGQKNIKLGLRLFFFLQYNTEGFHCAHLIRKISYTKCHNKFRQWCPGVQGPAKSEICWLLNSFWTTGSLIMKKWHQMQWLFFKETSDDAKAPVEACPWISFTCLSHKTNMSSHLYTQPHNCFIWNHANLLLCNKIQETWLCWKGTIL